MRNSWIEPTCFKKSSFLKKSVILLLFTICIIQIGVLGQEKSGFILNGKIQGLKDNAKIYLILERDTVAQAISNGETFELKGYVDGEANFYFLKTDSNIVKGYSNALWLVNGKMSLEGSVHSFKQLSLTGSEPQNEYLEMKELTGFKITPDNLPTIIKYVNEHSNSLYIPYVLISLKGNLKKEDVFPTYNKLSERAKSSFWGKAFFNKINNDSRYSELKVGGKMIDFYVSDVNDKKVSILELSAKSKYTLLDFWASWCVPCRGAIPEMKRVYEDFHNKGFNIVGISTDKKKESWRKAISEDNTSWKHTLDNIEDASKEKLRILALPGYILLDEKGTIIKMNFYSTSKTISNNSHEKSLSKNLYEIISNLY